MPVTEYFNAHPSVIGAVIAYMIKSKGARSPMEQLPVFSSEVKGGRPDPIPSQSCGIQPDDHTTANLFSRIPGRLASEIIRAFMDNNSPSDDLFGCKTVGVEYQKGIAVVGEEHRHISCMEWVRHLRGVEMPAGLRKGIGGRPFLTAPSFMDMKPEWSYRRCIPCSGSLPGKAVQLGCHQGSPVGRIKIDRPHKAGISGTAFDISFSIGCLVQQHVGKEVNILESHVPPPGLFSDTIYACSKALEMENLQINPYFLVLHISIT